jgi:hypothetical protein
MSIVEGHTAVSMAYAAYVTNPDGNMGRKAVVCCNLANQCSTKTLLLLAL